MSKFISKSPSSLKSAREAANLTLEQVAVELHLTRQAVENIEKNPHIGRKYLDTLARLYGLDLETTLALCPRPKEEAAA
jgi:transcriptional regulator with XRE-family HTH domain